jgi:glycosyl transferase, family 25
MHLMPSIFVINLKHRTDRRIAMQKQLSRIGWHAEFFPAIRPKNAADFPSIGARGCYLSHLSVLKNARDAGVQQLVILEDDVNFASEFSERWKFSISALETREWSIFYPGHTFDDLSAGLSRIPPDTGVQCTHFMVINGHAISTLIAGLGSIMSRPAGHPLGGPMHLDGAYSTLRTQNHSLVTYAHFPALGYQRPSRTDVGELKWFDRPGVLMPIANIVRKLKARL